LIARGFYQHIDKRGLKMNQSVIKSIFVSLLLAGTLTIAGIALSAAEKASSSKDAAVERTRQEVKMLDDLYKTVVVLFTEHLFTLCPPTTIERNSSSVDKAHYVKDPKTLPAASASKALFAEMKKKGWHEVRLLGLTDKLFKQDNKPSDAFEQAAAKKLLAGKEGHEEVVEKGGKRYLRVATGIPVVMEQCLMCHPTWKGNKRNIGALSYTVPVVEYDWSGGVASRPSLLTPSTPPMQSEPAMAEQSAAPDPAPPLPETVDTEADRGSYHAGTDAPSHAPPSVGTPPAGTYTIQRGDTLMAIAAHFYSDASQWSVIAEANPEADPRRLLVGQEIKLPPRPSPSR
jgi:LysM repeat protein